jgi:hypothetical protein
MKIALVVVAALVSASCVSPTAPSAKQWICSTQERCSYDALFRRTCRVDQYVSQTPCPATPIP